MMNGIPTFVKWAGGKKQLISQFKGHFPKKIDRYFEPFVGGGAVAFYIIKNYSPKEVYLSDSNSELINTYKIIRDNVEELIKELKQYKKLHSKEFYYKIRAESHEKLSPVLSAARFIYLNKTCFNGLYRVNSKGQFNVPMGSYKNPAIYNENELREISTRLKNVVIETKQFYNIKENIQKGDFVYFDPPYYPSSKTASFTTYTKENFLEEEQIMLAELYRNLTENGANVMLSNSDTDFIKNLYKNYTITIVKATRMINCNAKKRGKVNEVVITNYEKLIYQVPIYHYALQQQQ
jgi:DNA adenine methylase